MAVKTVITFEDKSQVDFSLHPVTKVLTSRDKIDHVPVTFPGMTACEAVSKSLEYRYHRRLGRILSVKEIHYRSFWDIILGRNKHLK